MAQAIRTVLGVSRIINPGFFVRKGLKGVEHVSQSGVTSAGEPCRGLYVCLVEGGLRGGRGGKPGILHVKCVVAHGRWLFLSSANLTELAFSINMGFGGLIMGGGQPGVVERQFQQLTVGGLLVESSPGRRPIDLR